MMNPRAIMGPLGVTLIGLTVVIIGVAVQIRPLLAAVALPGDTDEALSDRIAVVVKRHENESNRSLDRIIGRSAFYAPDPPPPLPPRPSGPTPPPPVQRDVGPMTTYNGSLRNPVLILGDVVHFGTGGSTTRVKVGQTVQGVRLVAVNPPFSVQVAWTAPPTATERYAEGIYTLWVFEHGVFSRHKDASGRPFAPSAPQTGLEQPAAVLPDDVPIDDEDEDYEDDEEEDPGD